MKNESRIEELLAESLRKQDQMIERLDRHDTAFSKMINSLDRLTDLLINSNQRMDRMEGKLDQVIALDEKVKAFEKKILELEQRLVRLESQQ